MTISTKQYTEGLCGDGAAILCDGVPLSISEILEELQSGATAKADLLALQEAQPVAWQQNWAGNNWQDCSKEMFEYLTAHPDQIVQTRALFTAPPAPAVCGELLDAMDEVIRISDRDHEAWSRAKAAISACRAAMLQPVSQGYTLNSPVIPDGWKLVPNEPTAKQWAAGYKAMEGGIDKVTLAYRAMVEVAPSPGGSDDGHTTAT